MTAKAGVLPLAGSGGGGGTVTSFSFTDLNGFTGVVANPTTAPNLTIGTSVTGILYGDGAGVAAAVAGNFPTLNQNTTGSAATLTTARNIAITGDLAWNVNFDGSANATAAGTLATVNANVGTFGSATQVGQFTVNAKGLITAAAGVTVTPAVGSITGLGTGIATALGVNVGSAGAPVLFNGAGGTPSSLTLTNATGLPVAGGGTGIASLTAYAPIFGGTTGTGAVQSGTVGTAGHVLTSNGAGALPTFQAAAGGAQQYMNVRDEKANNTAGGSSVAGTWTKRDLNTVVANSITSGSVSSSQITLPAGTYRIFARAPAYKQSGSHKLKLRNITDGADTIIGSNANTGGAGEFTQTDSFVIGPFTIAGTKVFELQHRTDASVATDGFGRACNYSVVEVYAEVEIWKVA